MAPTLDEAYEILRTSDLEWLESTLLDRLKKRAFPARKTAVASREPQGPDSTCLGPDHVTTPDFAVNHDLSDHLTRLKAHDGSSTETTRQMLSDRRTATLLNLERETNQAHDLKELWARILAGLEPKRPDVPFLALYSIPEAGSCTTKHGFSESDFSSNVQTLSLAGTTVVRSHWTLQGALERDAGQLELPSDISWDQALEIFGPMLVKAMVTNSVQVLDRRESTFPPALQMKTQSRAWGDLCSSAAIIPIARRHRGNSIAFMVLGLDPRSHYDEEYQTFIALLQSQLERAIDSVSFATADEARLAAFSAEALSKERAILVEKLKVSELDARDQSTRFRRMADLAVVGMFEVGADGSLDYANNAWYEMTGYPHGTFPPLHWVQVIHEDDRGWFADQWLRLTKGETLQFEIRFSKPFMSDDFVDGQRLSGVTWVAATAYSERDSSGAVKHVLGTIVDISRHKWIENFQERRAAEAWELKRQQEAFMDMTSHEIRNPLSAISLCVESIQDTYENILETSGVQTLISRDTLETTLDSANTIMACVSHQKAIIDDVLTLSKLNSGLLQIFPTEIDPWEEISQTVKMFDVEMQEAEIDFELKRNESYGSDIGKVLLDPVRLRQILINLLTNAIKFTKDQPCRQITVSVAASVEPRVRSTDGVDYLSYSSEPAISASQTKDTMYLSVTVKDTGRGIEKSELDHLFRRFQQGSPKTHVKYGGSGLGLFICKELARLQGGRVGAVSEKGIGSTFAFYIQVTKTSPGKSPQPTAPLRKSRDTASDKNGSGFQGAGLNKPSKEASQRPTGSPAKGLHILLVEDNLVNQRVMAKQLMRAGHTVTIKNHGREALDYLGTTHFVQAGGTQLDVIICDIEMPIMDGLECSRQIRKMEMTQKISGTVPLIAVTANARFEQQKEAIDAGFNSVITKPFRMSSLLPELESHCLRKRGIGP